MNRLQRYLMTRRADDQIKRRNDPLYHMRVSRGYVVVVMALVLSLICFNCTRL